LLRAEDCVLGRIGYATFHHALNFDLDRFTSCRITSHASVTVHQHQFAEARETAICLKAYNRSKSLKMKKKKGRTLLRPLSTQFEIVCRVTTPNEEKVIGAGFFRMSPVLGTGRDALDGNLILNG